MVKNNYYHFTDVGLLWFEMQVRMMNQSKANPQEKSI